MIPGGRLLLVNKRVSEIRATDWRVVKGRREGGSNESENEWTQKAEREDEPKIGNRKILQGEENNEH